MTLTQTEQEELRIAIAEEMGWKSNPFGGMYPPNLRPEININQIFQLPPYTTSLDAIQAAALERFKDEKQASEFRQELGYVACSDHPFRWTWQLTALDWCVAFARTAKIWRFK